MSPPEKIEHFFAREMSLVARLSGVFVLASSVRQRVSEAV
jgi:hypothetical protein